MAYGNTALTFSDLRKRMDPDGKIAWIMEIMAQSNPIMQHIPWMEGNLPTGNQTTLRTSYPHPQLRRINRGIKPGKSTTRQIVDTCCLMEGMSQVDGGENAVTGIYPKGSQAGLKMEDKGEHIVEDADGGKYNALVTWFSWDAGLAVQNLRKVAAIRNVDMGTEATSTTAAAQKALVENIIIAKNRIVNPKRPILYVSDTTYTMLELYLNDKNNVYVTQSEAINGIPKLYVQGLEVSKCDALSEKESVITE